MYHKKCYYKGSSLSINIDNNLVICVNASELMCLDQYDKRSGKLKEKWRRRRTAGPIHIQLATYLCCLYLQYYNRLLERKEYLTDITCSREKIGQKNNECALNGCRR